MDQQSSTQCSSVDATDKAVFETFKFSLKWYHCTYVTLLYSYDLYSE